MLPSCTRGAAARGLTLTTPSSTPGRGSVKSCLNGNTLPYTEAVGGKPLSAGTMETIVRMHYT